MVDLVQKARENNIFWSFTMVRLSDDTCGKVIEGIKAINQKVTVKLFDENGSEIFVSGVIVEIF